MASMTSVSSLRILYQTSVGKKVIVGITGLMLSGFCLSHMAGNMLIFLGPDAYNTYGYKLTHMPGFLFIELGLAIVFLIHIGLALKLQLENRKAKPQASAQKPSNCEKDARFGSKYMALTGLVILVFVILHLLHFRFGEEKEVLLNGVEVDDLYSMVVERLRDPLYAAWYVIAMCVLFVHLAHGFAATFQSLGLASVRNICIKKLGWAFAAIVCLGFASQPLYVFFALGGK